ncbi:DNA binding domain-containing protein, excisionase family [Chitinophaga jiangningensis]|uniref:DNA binding domain-containing protein, excisionase family n=1 Tax=Chitinophaga jiangningensis TaxID=1419482 RepID=A0A1M7H0Z0_9BACT|nr:helix-turn-helix domain-containing protein [Chitinophaga jiangningensis]SHM21819.1 DNA binding domain-containing protein, excisionase family [Chitinophaga jiangningensis]
METILEKTSKRDQKIVKALEPKVAELSAQILNSKSEAVTLHFSGHGDGLEVPKSALMLFFTILEKMASNSSFAILFSGNDEEISTQQAAEILGVSRPFLVNLLEKGEIPFHKVGSHRRVKMEDLIKYEKKLKKARKESLDFLAEQAQKLKMGY